MNNLVKAATQNPLAVAAVGYGLYSAAGRYKNIQAEQGCPKCEWTQLLLGVALAGFAGWTLYKATK